MKSSLSLISILLLNFDSSVVLAMSSSANKPHTHEKVLTLRKSLKAVPAASFLSAATAIVLSQTAVNAEILSMINEAREHLTWISMMSQHSDPDLIKAINGAITRGVDVNVYHNVNPYVAQPPAHLYPLNIVPMHGTRLFNFVATLLGSYVNPMRSYVTHSRFIINETQCMFGGVDFNRICEADNYVQHAIKISLTNPPKGLAKQDLEDVVKHLKLNHLCNYSFPTDGALIGTSAVDSSALDRIMTMIRGAKHSIFIENQYFQHTEVLSAIAARQSELPNIKVTLVGNRDFAINPYHPGKDGYLSSVIGFALSNETVGGLKFLRKLGCSFQFRTYRNKYTHNKIFIVDGTQLVIGTFNLHQRSLIAGHDFEIGIVIEGEKTVAKYMKDVMEETVITMSTKATGGSGNPAGILCCRWGL